MPTVQLAQGTIHYREAGPADGRPIVFVHGYLMAGDLWEEVGGRLAARGLRALMPTWPLGSQPEPLRPGADVTPRGVAAIVAAFLEELELEDAVLVGNDTGGAICQLVAVDHPQRVGALVLTNCDAFENFPPGPFKALIAAAKLPGGLKAALAPMRSAKVRSSPLAFGLLSHGDVDHLARGWVAPALQQPEVMEDLRRFTVAVDNRLTLEAATRLPAFEGPVLIAWAPGDRLFPIAYAHRLAALFRDARLETVERSRTFVMIDQPERLATLIAEHAAQRSAAGHAMR